MSNKLKITAAAIVVVLLSVWVYRVYHRNAVREATVAAVRDTAERLRSALAIQRSDTMDFERDAAAVDAHLTALRKRDTARIQPLADAADDYLVTAREILRREAAMQKAGAGLATGLAALAQHVQTDRGRADWTANAMRLRADVDRDARAYRIAAESYVEIVASLPQSQAKIAAQVDPALLLDAAAVKAARERALDGLARTEENVRRVTNLGRAR